MKYTGRLAVLGGLCAGGLLLMLGGCAATDASDHDEMSDMYGHPSKALNDPFGYSPDMSNTDISGGGAGDFDSKGFNRDVNDAANP